MKPTDLRLNGAVIRYDASVLPVMEPGLFDEGWLRDKGCWQGSTQGRSQAHFFHFAGVDMVLRHFRRGGMIGRVNRDLYLRGAPGNSRAFREFDLLREMHAAGLPVPVPVAAHYVPFGPFYRADIITQRIANARPLQDILSEQALGEPLWRAVGACVRRMHDHGVFHSDLNCRNILMDGGDRIWLIDFDKCERRAPGDWTQGNLDRLHRSLTKTATQTSGFHWRAQDWDNLLVGYGD